MQVIGTAAYGGPSRVRGARARNTPFPVPPATALQKSSLAGLGKRVKCPQPRVKFALRPVVATPGEQVWRGGGVKHVGAFKVGTYCKPPCIQCKVFYNL